MLYSKTDNFHGTNKMKLPEIKLVGVKVRTSNAEEMCNKTAKIGKTIERYFAKNLSQKISNKRNPGTTYCVYTEYESNENGQYTYFVGEEVESFHAIDSNFVTLTIPPANYIKFERGPGKMPMICIEAWKEIWQMSDSDLGGRRAYIADFEIYDERSRDRNNTTLDIYIGIEQ